MIAPAPAGVVGPLRLARLLVGLRYRSWRGMLKAGPRVGAARFAAVFAFVVPAAYVGLLSTALAQMGQAGEGAQQAALALVAAVITACNLFSKVAGADLVVGRGGEIELLLARPLSLARLVVARGLAGVLTDGFGALFLLPVLVAAALVWRLPAAALALALAISVLVQISVSVLAQAGQIAVVFLVPPHRRRGAFVLAALLAAAGMAGLWMTGSAVLRAPAAAAQALAPWHGWLLAGPGGWITGPLRHLHQGQLGWAGLTVLGLALAAGLALLLAALVARAAAARGWEQAGPSWAEAGRSPGAGAFSALGLAGKDWRLLVRERTRLVTLLALPTLFIGAQVFGAAGWEMTSGSPTRLAICAYSLAAYVATFGPLVHLQAERRAFWILRAVPVSLTQLFARKAGFWSLILAGFAAVIYTALAVLAGFPGLGEVVVQGLFAVLGVVVVAWLAVGLGAAEADLSDDQRSALGLGTAYLFMIVSGLYNLVLLAHGADRLRALALFVLVTVIAFQAGVAHARDAFDADVLAHRRLSPVAGALGMILVFLGARAVRLAGTSIAHESVASFELGWLLVVAGFSLWHWWHNHRPGLRRSSVLRTSLAALAIATAAAAVITWFAFSAAPLRAQILLFLRAGLEELLARGIVQAGLLASLLALSRGPGDAHFLPQSRRWLAAAVSVVLVVIVAPAPASLPALLAALLPALAFALSGRLLAALPVRWVIEAIFLFF